MVTLHDGAGYAGGRSSERDSEADESHAATAVLMLSLSRGAAVAAAARHSMHPKDAFILRKAAGLPSMGSPDSQNRS